MLEKEITQRINFLISYQILHTKVDSNQYITEMGENSVEFIYSVLKRENNISDIYLIMQNLLIPFTRELQKIENCIDNKGEQASFLGSLSEQMAKTKQNILKLEAIHQNKRKISCDYLQKLQKLDNKLTQSMEHSSQKRESQLQAIQVKLKKKNQKRKIHHEIEKQEPEEVKPTVKIQQTPTPKKEVTFKEIPEIKLAQPKQLNEEEFFKKLNMSMDAAIQRRSQRLQNIQVRLHAQDEIIHQHIEKSMKYKEEQEQNKLTQMYSKLMQATQKKQKQKIKHLKQNHSLIQNKPKQRKFIEDEYFHPNQSRTARSITEDQKFIKVKERLEKQREEREQIALSILHNHSQYSYRIRQSKQLMDELSNTCQYYNFKIKESFFDNYTYQYKQ